MYSPSFAFDLAARKRRDDHHKNKWQKTNGGLQGGSSQFLVITNGWNFCVIYNHDHENNDHDPERRGESESQYTHTRHGPGDVGEERKGVGIADVRSESSSYLPGPLIHDDCLRTVVQGAPPGNATLGLHNETDVLAA